MREKKERVRGNYAGSEKKGKKDGSSVGQRYGVEVIDILL